MATQLDTHYAHQPKPFFGVRFVLIGFDSINQHQVISKLVNGGGVDAGQYTPNCTHVIVGNLVYDDPVCVAARKDGKILVTGLWVDHSFDIGMPVDHTSIMYRPLKDLNGIPGAKNYIMCLTGYQRQDRDDVMTMVGLMGAQFSKPLVANKVTHLICYKFEGEKYELAKKIKIKLVNHKWLEDCLNSWQILPEANYSKSGYELEMETEAKDSEEEEEDNISIQFRGRKMNSSPFSIQVGTPRTHVMQTSVGVVSKIPIDTNVSIGPSSVVNHEDIPSVMGKYTSSGQASSLKKVNEQHHEALGCQKTQNTNTMFAEQPDHCDRTPISTNVGSDPSFTSAIAKKSPHSGVGKLSGTSYSRKTPRRTTLQTEVSSNLSGFPKIQSGALDKAKQVMDLNGFGCFNTPHRGSGLLHEEERAGLSPQKRKMDASCASSKTQKINHDYMPCISAGQSVGNEIQRWESTPLTHGPSVIIKCNSVYNDGIPLDDPALLNSPKHSPADMFPTKPSSNNRKSLTHILPVSETMTSKIGQDNNPEKAPQSSFGRLEESASACKPATVDYVGNQVQQSESTPLTHGPSEINKDESFYNDGNPLDDPALLNSAKRSPVDMIRTKSSSYNRKSLTHILPVSETMTMTSKIGQDSNTEKTPQKSFGRLEESAFPCKTARADFALGSSVHEAGVKSHSPVTLGGENDDSHLKPVEKIVAKKSLGSRGKRGISRLTITANRKGSIYLDRTASQNDAVVCSVGGKGPVSHEEPSRANKLEVPSCLNGIETLMEMRTQEAPKTGNDMKINNESMDDETEAPDDNDDEIEKAVIKRSEVAEVPQKLDIMMEETSEEVQHATKASTADAMVLEGDRGKTVDDKNIELGESTCTTDNGRRKATKGKKCPLGKTKINTGRAVTKNLDCERNVGEHDKICGNSKIEEGRGSNKLENTMEVEKEKKPIKVVEKSLGGNTRHVGKKDVKSVIKQKVAVKSNRTTLKTNQKDGRVDPDSFQVGEMQKKLEAEPMWFLLSGHRLQRKEFQKIIRHLKGKLCRDSHQWSYQATHFIVPDPIRRTEKFFAGAASGRWILDSDYLSASSQAGKFLAEESYEWHKNGLSEDGTINLQAPRKWRLLREKTGHGAFYGMRIIIYGDCIAPPLDTLKRAVKAGDGTILATSPPYTRFLNSGVDFAVVSPSMPRVDMWVQEFLKHEVPCVLADYLVEYVCKPGYSLERHVQYNTHAWAEKSFANLLSRSEEIVEDLTTPDNHEDDLSCQVCGSSDRGEVMLICGDESGSVGCGIGTHINCCDPPLEEIPEEDWFCPNCIRSKNSAISSENTKKRTSKSKR